MEENENIIIDNTYVEMVNSSQVAQNLMKKTFPVKPNYWLSKAIEKTKQEGKPYYEAKQKLVEKYRKQEDENSDKSELNNKDMASIQAYITKLETENASLKKQLGMAQITDMLAFTKELQELQAIEIPLGIKKVKLDLNDPKCPDLNIEEMRLLLPLIEDIEP